MRCAKCGTNNPADSRFCNQCATPLSRACPKCAHLNAPDAKFCAECATPLSAAQPAIALELAPAAPGPTAAGERRHLTVLFCDLVGSTPLSQQLDAEAYRDIIAQYQQAAADAVARFGGHVARRLGDGLLVYFGWPTARQDDPERAIRAGLAILEAMVPLNSTLAAGGALRLAVRIGMHTGPVVIADGGDVFGETANVAARVQTAAEQDTVVITAATHRLVAGMFVVEDRGPQALKGLQEPIILYRVVQPSGVRSRLDIAAGRFTPFIGRKAELATLVDRWERARDGEGQNVLIVGEAGVGKSRLLYQLREHLAAVPHTWLECGATPYTEGTPFHPVIGLVSKGLALIPDDTAVEKLRKLESGLGALASKENMALTAEFLELPASMPLTMRPDVKRQKTIELLTAWNLALSVQQPLVLLVEDLHWCDPSSLELLGRLIAQSPTARVLLLATARPEFTPPWPARSNITTLQLAQLTKRESQEMVATLGGSGLPTDTLDALIARADGVPLYVEELTKVIVEPGAARGVEAIPATLADSLMGRLDRLSAAKEIAQRAAVLGREFSYPLLAAVAGIDNAALQQRLARLVEAEIVFVRGEPPDAIYTFKHALVQEAAYDSLLKRTRQQLHGRVVEVLLAQFPERAAAEPELMGRHAELAARIDEAISYYQRAGEQAHARSAYAEAIHHLRHSIALLATQPESRKRDAREVLLQVALGASLIPARGFGHVEVEAAYERARVLCEALGDSRHLAVALNGLALFSHTSGHMERAYLLGARVLALAQQQADTGLALEGHVRLATVEYFQGKFTSSLAHLEAARTLYLPGRYYDATDLSPAAFDLETWNLFAVGSPDRALTRARQLVALTREMNDYPSLAECLLFETAVHWLRRDTAAQRERAAETIAVCEAHGLPEYLGVGRAFHAATQVAADQPEPIAALLAGIALTSGTGTQAGAPALLALVGEAYIVAGQMTEARGTVEAALALAAQTGQPFFDSELHRLQGEIVLVTRGSPAEAEAFFQTGARNRARSGSEVLRVARRDQPRPLVARPGQTHRSAQPSRHHLQLVHRRLRHRRPDGCEGAAR